MRWMLALLVPVVAIAGGSVEGRVVDPTGASIPKSLVRLMPKDSGETKYRTESDDLGSFSFSNVTPGEYVVRASHVGFRESSESLTVRDGKATNARSIKVPIIDCDGPVLDCLIVTAVNEPLPPVLASPIARGGVGLQIGCALDLDAGASRCEASTRTDLRFVAGEGGKLYLELINGAKLCDSPDQRVRVDGLGPGNRWCVATRTHHRSQVYINLSVVEPGADFIGLFFTTR
jgi:hypothetical protein